MCGCTIIIKYIQIIFIYINTYIIYFNKTWWWNKSLQIWNRKWHQTRRNRLPEGRPWRPSLSGPGRQFLRGPRWFSHLDRLHLGRERLPTSRRSSANSTTNPSRDPRIFKIIGFSAQHSWTNLPVNNAIIVTLWEPFRILRPELILFNPFHLYQSSSHPLHFIRRSASYRHYRVLNLLYYSL